MTETSRFATSRALVFALALAGVTAALTLDARKGAADAQAPTVTVLSPNTSQVIAMGVTRSITWKALDNVGVASVALDFSADSGATWLPIAAGLANTGSYTTWKVPNIATTRALVRATARDSAGHEASDVSNQCFEVRDRLAPTCAVTTPNGGELYGTGTSRKMTWKSTDNVGVTRVDLSYSPNGGTSWISVAGNVANTGFYYWTIPHTVTTSGLFKVAVRDSAGNASSDASNAPFEIRDATSPVITVTTPNGGQIYATGTTRKMTWSATDNVRVTSIDLAYSRDGGATWTPIASGLPHTGSYMWAIPPTPGAALFKATARDSMGSAKSDVGDAPFTIVDQTVPVASLTAPNGGEVCTAGSVRNILWSASDDVAVTAVDLELSADAGATWSPIATGLANTGSHAWNVPALPTTQARVRVTARDAAGNAAADASNANFEITAPAAGGNPTVTITAPNGGDTLVAGTTRTITWYAADAGGIASVALYYSIDGGGYWTPVTATLAGNPGSFDWVIPDTPTSHGLVRATVTDLDGHTAVDFSDAPFRITRPVFLPDGVTPYRLVSLRADSASGSGPHPIPSNAGPWTDLAGSHDAWVQNFHGTHASGWTGNGTALDPHRLEFTGIEARCIIPAGSIPELQSLVSVSAEMWFRLGHDGAQHRYDYLLEWVQYGETGMSIAVENGRLMSWLNPWIDMGAVAPNTWYHVAVVKDYNEARLYVNGQRVYTGVRPNLGVQLTDVVLGASIFRYIDGTGTYGDYLHGAIAQMHLWRGALSDAAVRASYVADSARYANPAPPPVTEVVHLEASQADGAAPHPLPGAGSPWVDLSGVRTNGALTGFAGTAASGWQGDGTPASPHRLQFDGVDDAVAIAAGAVTELRHASAHTVELRFKTGANVLSSDYRYLAEWLEGFGTSNGMSLAIADGKLRLYLDNPYWVDLATVANDTWYRVTVAKEPGEVRAWVNGARVLTASTPNFGAPVSEIVLGASTWRGAGQYGEHWDGAISSFKLWQGALRDSQVAAASVIASQPQMESEFAPVVRAGLSLAGARPNPARGVLKALFSLPSAEHATLDLIDVTGRRIEGREVGALGAGTHHVTLGEGRRLEAGVYWLKLTQGPRVMTQKAIVVE